MDIQEVKIYLKSLIKTIFGYLDDYEKYVINSDIPYNYSIITQWKEQVSFLDKTIDSLDTFDYKNEVTIRYVLSQLSSIYSSFSWRSNSYSEAINSNSFQLELLNTNRVNYSRYDHYFLDQVENYIKNLYSIPDDYQCFVTSSGMSAFDTVLHYLIWLGKLSNIYVPRYIYFESLQQIKNYTDWSGSVIQIWSSNINEDEIIEYILKHKPKTVFLDPRTNTAFIKELNIPYILNKIEDINEYKPTFIIDVSMIGTDIEFCYKQNIEIITYMSWSKYLWFGFDISMMGVVICKKEIWNAINIIRRNTGWVLYENSCLLFPMFGKNIYLSRLDSLEKTAIWLYQALSTDEFIKTFFELSYPKESKYKFRWAIVTINFIDKNMRKKELYSEIIDSLIRLWKEEWVPIVHWVSFWFSTTRVSASDVMSWEEDVFLRVSCWISEYYDLSKLSYIFKKSLYAIINR